MNPAPRLPEHPDLGDIRFISRLSGGGGWNETWLAARGEERLVVRLDTPAVRALGLDRAAETAVLRSIAGRGLGPKLVYSDATRGVLVTSLLEGRTCTPAMLRHPRRLRALGALLRRLHRTAAPPSVTEPLDLRRALALYASILGGARARRTARAALGSIKAAAGGRRGPALCHNDPVAQNVLCGPALRLIDWEFAAPGDPLFDLAVVVGHNSLNEREARTLLASARGRAHLSDWRALGHLVDGYEELRLLWEAAARKAMA